jgi:hypothetical protein
MSKSWQHGSGDARCAEATGGGAQSGRCGAGVGMSKHTIYAWKAGTNRQGVVHPSGSDSANTG